MQKVVRLMDRNDHIGGHLNIKQQQIFPVENKSFESITDEIDCEISMDNSQQWRNVDVIFGHWKFRIVSC
jgi:hypothetical protein